MEPARLTTSEVCELARYKRDTLWRRIREGKMPKPVDRGREALFDRAAVEKALGLQPQEVKNAPSPFGAALDALPPR